MRRWPPLVVLVLVTVAGCGDDRSADDGSVETTTTETPEVLEVVTEWECIATPGDLAAKAATVVVAAPLTDETVLMEEPSATGGRFEVLATSMEVADVLAGEGLAAGEQFVLTRRVEYQPVSVDGVDEERQVGGDGYPGPPVAEGYILGLIPDGGAWTAIAGAHGRVALTGVDGTATVLSPAPGADGRLQVELAGEPLEAFGRDLLDPGATSPCADEEEHGHD